MRKSGFFIAVVLLVVLLGGCDLLFEKDVAIRAWNANYWIAVVQYRASGTSAWTTAVSLLDTGLDEAEIFTIPEGTYDFRVFIE